MLIFLSFFLFVFAAHSYQGGEEGWEWWLASAVVVVATLFITKYDYD